MQAVKELAAQVAKLQAEVAGFEKAMEELRAAGRVEAMEDLMSNLLGELVRPKAFSWQAQGLLCTYCIPSFSEVREPRCQALGRSFCNCRNGKVTFTTACHEHSACKRSSCS